MSLEDTETASGDHSQPPSETVRIARLEFDTVQRVRVLEGRWALRHPVYARMLDWVLVGPRLRARRRRYVVRMLDRVEFETRQPRTT